MAWAETWFLDFKVLPREQKARERGEFTGGVVSVSTQQWIGRGKRLALMGTELIA